MREQERATKSEETERSSWGLATLAASEGGGQPGLLRVGFFFAFVSSGRRTREPLVLSQRGRSTGQRSADIPNNNVGQEPVLAGKNRPFLEVWTCTRLVINGVYNILPVSQRTANIPKLRSTTMLGRKPALVGKN